MLIVQDFKIQLDNNINSSCYLKLDISFVTDIILRNTEKLRS